MDNPAVPARCPKCGKPPVKEVTVRKPLAPGSAIFVPQKGTIKYDCGAQFRWEHKGLEVVNTVEPCKPLVNRVAA